MPNPSYRAARGLPEAAPANVLSVGLLAEQEGWTVRPTYTTVPKRTIVLRFGKPNCPSIYAMWTDSYFSYAYARTAQRLSFGDLKAVLRDPTLLEQDQCDPFGTIEAEANVSA